MVHRALGEGGELAGKWRTGSHVGGIVFALAMIGPGPGLASGVAGAAIEEAPRKNEQMVRQLYSEGAALFAQGAYVRAAGKFEDALHFASDVRVRGGLIQNRARAHENAFVADDEGIENFCRAWEGYGELIAGESSGFDPRDVELARDGLVGLASEIVAYMDRVAPADEIEGVHGDEAFVRWKILGEVYVCSVDGPDGPWNAIPELVARMGQHERQMLSRWGPPGSSRSRRRHAQLLDEAESIGYGSSRLDRLRRQIADARDDKRRVGIYVGVGSGLIAGGVAMAVVASGFVPRAEDSIVGANLSGSREREIVNKARRQGFGVGVTGGVLMSAGIALVVSGVVRGVRSRRRAEDELAVWRWRGSWLGAR